MSRQVAKLQAGPVDLPDGRPERREVVTSAEEAVSRIQDGMTVIVGGFVTANHPMPLVREIIRQDKRDLTLIANATAGLEADLLVGSGCVRKLLAPYCGGELFAPVGNCFRKMIESGDVELWECSEYILYAGLQARAMGVEFMAWRGGVGTSIPELNPDLKVFKSPLDGKTDYIAVPEIKADWALLHVGWADVYGNGQHTGARYGDRLFAQAADRVMLTAERVVPNAFIRRNPVMTSVPYADVVVEAPFASHPYASHGFYGEDEPHIEEYVRVTADFRKGDASGFEAYLDKWMRGPADHDEYLDVVGGRRLRELEREFAGRTLGRNAPEIPGTQMAGA